MYIKYTDLDNPVIIHLPDTAIWSIRTSDISPNGCVDYNLYLAYDNKQYFIRDTDIWSSGRPSLRDEEVHELYKEIVEVICRMLVEKPELKVIDIDEIENSLFPKYEKLWAEKGYITIDENGCW